MVLVDLDPSEVGEEPSSGNNPWLEKTLGWKRPFTGKDLAVENAQTNFHKPLAGDKQASGWIEPLAGNSPWLEAATGWKQPFQLLAGNSSWLASLAEALLEPSPKTPSPTSPNR